MKKTTTTRKARPVKKALAAQDSAGHLGRVNALLKWWGAPPIDFSVNERQLHCLHQFTDGVQSLYRDVSNRQRQLLEEAGRDISSGATDMAWPRKPSVLLGIQSAMAIKLLDGMSRQSRLWTDVAEGYVDCYAAFAKGTAEICHRRKHETGDSAAP